MSICCFICSKSSRVPRSSPFIRFLCSVNYYLIGIYLEEFPVSSFVRSVIFLM
nr:MAG TPA: hypothetical protein [Caudoviricetes sp.]